MKDGITSDGFDRLNKYVIPSGIKTQVVITSAFSKHCTIEGWRRHCESTVRLIHPIDKHLIAYERILLSRRSSKHVRPAFFGDLVEVGTLEV